MGRHKRSRCKEYSDELMLAAAIIVLIKELLVLVKELLFAR